MFTKCNDNFLLIPKGLSKTKISKFSSFLSVEPVKTSISGLRVIGPLVAMNNNGILVSRLTEDEEIREIKRETGLIGSMAVATNKGVVIHPHASEDEVKRVQDILKVDVEPSTINSGVPYVSSGIIANSKNAIVGNLTNGPELSMLSRILKV